MPDEIAGRNTARRIRDAGVCDEDQRLHRDQRRSKKSRGECSNLFLNRLLIITFSFAELLPRLPDRPAATGRRYFVFLGFPGGCVTRPLRRLARTTTGGSGRPCSV